MALLEVKSLVKRFGAVEVLRGIDFSVEQGEFVCLLGPSGCGKSTLLRLIAGLEQPSSGDIMIGGRSMRGVPPSERNLAMVFQSYALYPHLSVRRNMAFGLKLQGMPKAEINRRVAGAATMLGIDQLLERKPRQLSGGQRQRVAIGRAIVRDPQLFLFDEPLSNLDAALRTQTRYELARLHADLGRTMLFVTHDQVEAMTLASMVVVLNEGRVEQIGPPLDLYHKPANRFVAGFIGSPQMNFLPVQAVSGNLINVAGQSFSVPGVEGVVEAGIRPEHIRIVTGSAEGITADVRSVEQLGVETILFAATASRQPLVVRAAGSLVAKSGDRVTLTIDSDHLHLFDASGRRTETGAAEPKLSIVAS